MNARDEFSLFVEAAGPGNRAREIAQQYDEPTIAAVRGRWSGRVLGPSVSAEQIVEALGQPDVRDPSSIGYVLPSRPGYLYVFRFDTSGRQIAAGFRRDGTPPPLPRRTDDDGAFVAALAALGVTAEELCAYLGEPHDVDGWWPLETWRWRDGLTIGLRHGVVELC